MPRFGIPRREFDEQESNALQVNWRRGLMRVWVLLSAAWIMGWIVYLTIYGIQSGFQSSGDFLAILVLLISPPIALLLFGLVAGWAFAVQDQENSNSLILDLRPIHSGHFPVKLLRGIAVAREREIMWGKRKLPAFRHHGCDGCLHRA